MYLFNTLQNFSYAISYKKPRGWSLNFWASSDTLTLYQVSHNCMFIVSYKNVFSKFGTNKQL